MYELCRMYGTLIQVTSIFYLICLIRGELFLMFCLITDILQGVWLLYDSFAKFKVSSKELKTYSLS